MKRSFQVEIAGQRLSIRSDEGPQYVQQLADYVDAQLRQLTQGRRATPSVQRVALLVAIQLADELFRERDLHRRFRARVSDKLAALRQALDAHETLLRGMDAPAEADPDASTSEG
ncbi:cell division protein ZapA [Paraliomyxa miuraensis]|uniref:cell division protein ZapA n=1 Tax=Paraliomyxa miuraensis TaxID=376150 RepID=UPI002253AB17|nr:cell division protein ZapA [Paraliomyxa miuraensis]MCX4245485.1 cell division protein ZapA [Paraliomyxa miuraensis]